MLRAFDFDALVVPVPISFALCCCQDFSDVDESNECADQDASSSCSSSPPDLSAIIAEVKKSFQKGLESSASVKKNGESKDKKPEPKLLPPEACDIFLCEMSCQF